MPIPEADTRTGDRRRLDEQIAAEPPLVFPDRSPGQVPRPVEVLLTEGG
jgi:hypothetical protein